MQISQQEYKSFAVRNATILTNGYVAGYVIGLGKTEANGTRIVDDLDSQNSVSLLCDFTIGSLTNVAILVEFSDDNVTWFKATKDVFTAGINAPVAAFIQLTLTDKYMFNLNEMFFSGGNVKAKYIRVSASGVGTVTSSSLTVTALIGVG